MIVTQHFVLLHMPRTGGTWASKVLRETAPSPWNLKQLNPTHMTYKEAPPRCQKLPALILARNPWELYVSFYLHGKRIPDEAIRASGKNAVWRKLPFKQALPKIMGIAERHWAMIEGAEDVRVGRFERLRAEVMRLISGVVKDVPPGMRAKLTHDAAIHGVKHSHYREYYDDELAGFVAERDAKYIEEFGYKF